MIAVCVSCSDEPTIDNVSVNSVTLNLSTVSLFVGETIELSTTISPENATDKTIRWSSSNTNVATVENGIITAVAQGKAVISAIVDNKQANCVVTVNDIAVTAISLNETSITIYTGETVYLTATVAPDNATDKTIKWLSSNTKVATVNNGKVTAIAKGTATITAQVGSIKTECAVIVKNIDITAISLDQTSITMLTGEKYDLKASITPDNATDKSITWTTSDERVATVNNGTVTGITVGTATITAQAGSIKAECAVTVNPIKVSGITLNNTSISIKIGNIYQLTATVSPDNATDKTVTWSSSDERVATVNDGLVSGITVGTATITAQIDSIKAECDVTINPIEVTDISLNRSNITLTAGDIYYLTATVSPYNATDKTVIWSSSKSNVATVEEGKVTAVAKGDAIITAKSGNVQKICYVTVYYYEVTAIKLNKSTITLSTGETINLIATITPIIASNKTITWSSSNNDVATVENGKVTAVSKGSATITATTKDGPSAVCSIAVVNKPDSGGSEGTGEVEW